MRPFLIALLALAACAQHAARPSEPIASAQAPEPAPPSVSDPAAQPAQAAALPPAPAPAAIERRAVTSEKAPKAIGPYSQAIQGPADRIVYLSGQIALDPATGQVIEGDIAAQAERVMQNLQGVLEAAGASFDDVVKTNMYLADLKDFTKVNEVYGKRFQKVPPARATVQMAALPRGAKVEIEGIAVVANRPPPPGGHAPLASEKAPRAAGPYSQAMDVSAASWVFVSGQIPMDPAHGLLVRGDATVQATRVMENLRYVLEGAGLTFDDVVKTNMYLVDLKDFTSVNEVYARYFTKAPPARATVQAAGLPLGARVQIEMIAARSGSASSQGPVQSALAPKALGPYSQAVAVNPRSFLFASGQIDLDPATGQPLEKADIQAQTARVMENLKAVLEAGGAGFDKVVKATVFLADMNDSGKVNEVYARYFPNAPPARSTIQVAALPRGARVEVEVIATP